MEVINSMSDPLLEDLEAKLDTLIQHCIHLESECLRLTQENTHLLDDQSSWNQERAQLVEKNNLARKRVEAMITHLKSLESQE